MKTKFKCQQCGKEVELDTVFKFEVCPECRGNLFPLDGIQGECGVSDQAKLWWAGNPDIEPYMVEVGAVLSKYLPYRSEESVDIYNRVYEAMNASRKVLQSQLASRDALIERMIELTEDAKALPVGQASVWYARQNALVAEYRATVSKTESVGKESVK